MLLKEAHTTADEEIFDFHPPPLKIKSESNKPFRLGLQLPDKFQDAQLKLNCR